MSRPDLRAIPAVNQLADHVAQHAPATGAPRSLIVDAARSAIDGYRQELASGADPAREPLAELTARALARLDHARRPVLAAVINATGVIVHTGLGRAPLARAAARAAAEVAGHYAPVELEIDTGERGRRTRLVRDLLCRLTGAEAATVVNNNAAAMMIVLAAMATGREVIVSRGELIEIGGSFRLPDVMTAGGAILREVGTTNRTRLRDYERAIDETTAAIMKVHTSNYRVEGFTEDVAIADLAALGQRCEIPVIDDIGSGALRPTAEYGWPSDEPCATGSIAAGADLVLFSGDKLLGGPQAGIIVGRRHWVEAIERHPMMRAMRVDKVTLAALGATLQIHRDPAEAAREIPVMRTLTWPVDQVRERADVVAERLAALPGIADARAAGSEAYLGGGSVPTQAIESVAVVVRAESLSEDELARRLRLGTPAVFSRVADGAVHLDMRTVFADQLDGLVEAARLAAEG
ncbi:MAG: L-seryl-tRNA(Sec) selenium transferase [Planctomycetes bacterium]|nr:L-seryl-tRNA(Sec) selenium transferase [Planctomycetota bacterium]